MASVYQLLTRGDVERMLAPFGGHYVETIHPGSEMWSTGWGEFFVLSMEYDGIHYDEWLCLEAIDKVIVPTKPESWLLDVGTDLGAD